jgi:hypothetical protein
MELRHLRYLGFFARHLLFTHVQVLDRHAMRSTRSRRRSSCAASVSLRIDVENYKFLIDENQTGFVSPRRRHAPDEAEEAVTHRRNQQGICLGFD